jgi:beta-alanine degradation protein BauB
VPGFLLVGDRSLNGTCGQRALGASQGYHGGTAMAGTSKATVLIDNDRVVVTEHRFQPGEATGWHRHAHDYVIVPLMDGKLKLVTKDGDSIAEMKKGTPYFRSEGVEHDVINATDGEYAFIEIELK